MKQVEVDGRKRFLPSTSHKKLIELSAASSAAPLKCKCQIIGSIHTWMGRLPSRPSQVDARQDSKWDWLESTHQRSAPVEGWLNASREGHTGNGNHICNDYRENSRNFCCHTPSMLWLPTTVSPSTSLRHISHTIKVEWWPTLQVCRISHLFLHSWLLRQLKNGVTVITVRASDTQHQATIPLNQMCLACSDCVE